MLKHHFYLPATPASLSKLRAFPRDTLGRLELQLVTDEPVGPVCDTLCQLQLQPTTVVVLHLADPRHVEAALVIATVFARVSLAITLAGEAAPSVRLVGLVPNLEHVWLRVPPATDLAPLGASSRHTAGLWPLASVRRV